MEQNCNCMAKEINIPDEMPDFNAPGNVGAWRQLLAANIGRHIKIEISPTVSGALRSTCGTIYAVGNSYVVLVCDGDFIAVDTLSVKYVYFD